MYEKYLFDTFSFASKFLISSYVKLKEMMCLKKGIIVLLLCIVLVGGCLFIYKIFHPSMKSNLMKLNETMTSYELSGTLELVSQDALKSIQVQSLYKRENDIDYYYVRLEDEHTHQVQTIVKNQEGVFVYSQGFNRPFQFKTDWPNNSFKPYILNNVLNILLSSTQEKIQDGYVLSTELTEKTYPEVRQVKVLFDQHDVMQMVSLFDGNNQQVLKFNVTTYLINPDIDTNIFTLDSHEEVSSVIQEDLPLYPTHLSHVELIDQLQLSNSLVLRYKGEQYFSLVETPVAKMEEVMTDLNDLYVLEDGFIYTTNQEVSCIKHGIQTTIYATDLSLDEKLNILISLENKIVIDS